MPDSPAPTQDYQFRFLKFIDPIPNDPQEIPSGTPVIQAPFDKTALDSHAGEYQTNDKFRKFTGWEHESLLRKWLVDKTTTCNEFVQKCVIEMGYTAKDGVGRFDIADWLSQAGLSHVWITPETGAVPECGDVFRLFDSTPDENGMRLNHMAMVIKVAGDTLYSADSGQGGPIRGHDAIKRRERPWPPRGLRGWVSMKALLNVAKPLPFWLGGWWQVEEEPYDTWYYFFDANGKVTCQSNAPVSVVVAPNNPNALVGTFSSKRMFEVEIAWNSADVDETITCISDPANRKYSITGKTARGAKLSGKRLMLADRFG